MTKEQEEAVLRVETLKDMLTGEAKKENCKYCMEDNEAEIYGKDFELKPTAGFKRDRKYSSWIIVIYDESYDKLGILIPNKNYLAVRHTSLEFIFQQNKNVKILTKEQYQSNCYTVEEG